MCGEPKTSQTCLFTCLMIWKMISLLEYFFRLHHSCGLGVFLPTCPRVHLCSWIRLPFILTHGWQALHKRHLFLSQLWNWDLEFNGFWGGKHQRVRSPWDVSIEGVVCVWCTLPYFSLPRIGRSVCNTWRTCYQILKMLSSLPRLPTRAGDMSSSPLHRLSLCSLVFSALQMSESSSNLLFFSLTLPFPFSTCWYCVYYLNLLLLHL